METIGRVFVALLAGVIAGIVSALMGFPEAWRQVIMLLVSFVAFLLLLADIGD